MGWGECFALRPTKVSTTDSEGSMLKSEGLRKVTTMAAGLVLAALLVVLVVLWGVRPAEAAFPGVNGKIVFASDRTSGDGVDNPEGDNEIFSMNPDGTELIQLTHNDMDDEEPAYSADGQQIAFLRWREYDPDDFRWTTDIFTMDADGTNETSVTPTDLTYEFSPTWSPGGEHIAFYVKDFEFDPMGIYKMSAEGGKAVRLTRSSGLIEYYDPEWSPGGKRIAFTKYDKSELRSYIVRIKPRPVGRTNRPVTLAVGSQPSWSPNGAQIAFVRRGDIYKMASDGLKKKLITRDAAGPAWSPDGTRIAFVRNVIPGEHAGNEIFVMNKGGSGQERLTDNADVDDWPDWQPIVP
jgi:TolB protein